MYTAGNTSPVRGFRARRAPRCRDGLKEQRRGRRVEALRLELRHLAAAFRVG